MIYVMHFDEKILQWKRKITLVPYLNLFNIILPLLTVAKKKFYWNDSKIMEFEIIDTKNSSTARVVMYKFIT